MLTRDIENSASGDVLFDDTEIQRTALLSDSIHDVQTEKPNISPLPSNSNHEHSVSLHEKLSALAGYFLCNVGLTIYNKAVLGSLPFPWLLTALHAGVSFFGCLAMFQCGIFTVTRLTSHQNLALLAFSFLFTINIAVSNVSLSMVSIPIHQVVRATTPLFTTALYRILYARSFSTATYISLIPIVIGVALTTYGEYSFTPLGLILTFLGVILAALKTIITNRMMTGALSLSFWEVLLRMSPLACVQSLVYAIVTGELRAFVEFLQRDYLNSQNVIAGPKPVTYLALVLLGNGMLAFLLNISSFSTNKLAGALTMTVCANVKQCLTIILGIFLFNVRLSLLNAWGIIITVAGGVLYSFVELDSKQRRRTAGGGMK